LVFIALTAWYLPLISRKRWPVPWLNCADAYDTPQEAFDAYDDGNTIIFHPGAYRIEDSLNVAGNNIKILGLEGNMCYANDTFITIEGENILIQGLHVEALGVALEIPAVRR
jgi:hypothetical protein